LKLLGGEVVSFEEKGLKLLRGQVVNGFNQPVLNNGFNQPLKKWLQPAFENKWLQQAFEQMASTSL